MPSTPDARELFNNAVREEQAGNHSEALRLYKSSARADMNFRPAFMNLGALYSRARRPDLALGFFRRALELEADDAVFFNLGSECYKLEQYADAEGYLKQALKRNLRLLKAHILLAYLYKNNNRSDKAEIYFQNSLKIEPGNRMAALGYGVMLSEMHRYDDALRVVDSYLTHNADDESMKNLRAGLLLKLDRTEESLAEYKKLADDSPRFTSFTEHLKAARAEADDAHTAMFAGIPDRIKERTQRLKEKIAKRKKVLSENAVDASPASNGIEGAQDLKEELNENLKDMVDLSFLHLFNGDTDKALQFLFQARKMKKKHAG